MTCKRCHDLPKLPNGKTQIYISLPTKHHVDPVIHLLMKHHVDYRLDEDYLIVPSFDLFYLLELFKELEFSTIECNDIKLMPFSYGSFFDFSDLRNLKSLTQWYDLIDGSDIIEILASKRLTVHFQPIYDSKTLRLYGYEALIRGIDSKNSILPPTLMFQQAKKMDLLFHLDRLCRETIIECASHYNLHHKLFINFIPTAIYDPEKCLKSTDEAIKNSNLSPQQIVFEVVETEFVENFSHLNYILDYYKAKGYATALDDVGSGFANIDALKNLKPNYMKIDRSIISNIEQDKSKQKKLNVYQTLALDNNILILAEGIESKEACDFLRKCKLDLLQGYYLGKPKAKPYLEF